MAKSKGELERLIANEEAYIEGCRRELDVDEKMNRTGYAPTGEALNTDYLQQLPGKIANRRVQISNAKTRLASLRAELAALNQ